MNNLNIYHKTLYVIILLNLMFFNALHGQQFKSYHKSVSDLDKISSDSIFSNFEKSYKEALQLKDTLRIVNSLLDLSMYKRNHLDYASAFNYAGESLFLAEEYNNILLKAKAHEEAGVLAYLYKQDDEAGSNFKNAHAFYKRLFKLGTLDVEDLYQSHYNLIMYYQRTEKEGLLKAHIDSCSILGNEIKGSSLHLVYLNEKLASIEEWNGKTDNAIALLKTSINTLETLDFDFEENKIAKSFLSIVYGRIANIYIKKQELDLAKTYFEKSIHIKDVNGESVFYNAYIYATFSDLLAAQGDFKAAFENNKKASFINDTYLNPRNDKNKGFLIIRDRYKDQLVNKNELLNKQRLILAEQKQEVLTFRILFFVVLLVLVVLGFLVRSRIRSLKFQKKERDSNLLITIKNRELTSNTLQLIEKEEVIKKLSNYIKSSNSDKQSQSLLKSIERSSVSLWDAFNSRFTEQNIGFYQRLQKKIPNLSSSDLKLCALIKLNFSGKEMAYLLGISLGSIHVARHRLRKKMHLERDVNLTNYVNSI